MIPFQVTFSLTTLQVLHEIEPKNTINLLRTYQSSSYLNAVSLRTYAEQKCINAYGIDFNERRRICWLYRHQELLQRFIEYYSTLPQLLSSSPLLRFFFLFFILPFFLQCRLVNPSLSPLSHFLGLSICFSPCNPIHFFSFKFLITSSFFFFFLFLLLLLSRHLVIFPVLKPSLSFRSTYLFTISSVSSKSRRFKFSSDRALHTWPSISLPTPFGPTDRPPQTFS